jgi:hypothetical protein
MMAGVLSNLANWLENHGDILWYFTGFGLLVFFGSLIAIPLLIIKLPADYFVRAPIRDWPTRRPLVHLALVILKNIVGVLLCLGGIAMLVLPGQGLLTLLLGITMIDFPGKRKLELWLIRKAPLNRAANWLRNRYGHSSLRLPEHDDAIRSDA